MEQESLFDEEKTVNKESPKQSYSAESIQALEGIEHVRKRPSMYIGDVGPRGLHHLVYEVIDNSIDEAMGGYCDKIDLTINEDNSFNLLLKGEVSGSQSVATKIFNKYVSDLRKQQSIKRVIVKDQRPLPKSSLIFTIDLRS